MKKINEEGSLKNKRILKKKTYTQKKKHTQESSYPKQRYLIRSQLRSNQHALLVSDRHTYACSRLVWDNKFPLDIPEVESFTLESQNFILTGFSNSPLRWGLVTIFIMRVPTSLLSLSKSSQ